MIVEDAVENPAEYLDALGRRVAVQHLASGKWEPMVLLRDGVNWKPWNTKRVRPDRDRAKVQSGLDALALERGLRRVCTRCHGTRREPVDEDRISGYPGAVRGLLDALHEIAGAAGCGDIDYAGLCDIARGALQAWNAAQGGEPYRPALGAGVPNCSTSGCEAPARYKRLEWGTYGVAKEEALCRECAMGKRCPVCGGVGLQGERLCPNCPGSRGLIFPAPLDIPAGCRRCTLCLGNRTLRKFDGDVEPSAVPCPNCNGVGHLPAGEEHDER